MGRIRTKRSGGRTGARGRKVIRRRKEKTETRGESKFSRGENKVWGRRKTRKPVSGRVMRGTNKGTEGSRR